MAEKSWLDYYESLNQAVNEFNEAREQAEKVCEETIDQARRKYEAATAKAQNDLRLRGG